MDIFKLSWFKSLFTTLSSLKKPFKTRSENVNSNDFLYRKGSQLARVYVYKSKF